MKNTLAIRPFRKADAKAVALMMKKLGTHHGDKINPKANFFVDFALGPRKVAYIWVALDGKKPIGFIDAYYFANFKRGDYSCWVDYFFVEERHRKKGVGKALVGGVVRDSLQRGCHRFCVGAEVDNAMANRFYKDLGLIKGRSIYNTYVADELKMKSLAKL